MTNPENAANYAAASGYIAVNKKSYDTEKMKAVVAETRQYLVACDQMETYGYPQMMSLNIDAVREVLWTNLADLVAGNKTVAHVQADGQAGMTAAIGSASNTAFVVLYLNLVQVMAASLILQPLLLPRQHLHVCVLNWH